MIIMIMIMTMKMTIGIPITIPITICTAFVCLICMHIYLLNSYVRFRLIDSYHHLISWKRTSTKVYLKHYFDFSPVISTYSDSCAWPKITDMIWTVSVWTRISQFPCILDKISSRITTEMSLWQDLHVLLSRKQLIILRTIDVSVNIEHYVKNNYMNLNLITK